MIKKGLKFNWILKKELAVGSVPRRDDHIKVLKDEGITGVLSLCSKSEINFSNLLENNFQHRYLPLPDHSYGRNPSIQEILEALKIISDLRQMGSVFVHCYAGVERSPLICMAWLVKYRGFSPIEALEYLMQVNKGTNPLPGQFELLKDSLLTNPQE